RVRRSDPVVWVYVECLEDFLELIDECLYMLVDSDSFCSSSPFDVHAMFVSARKEKGVDASLLLNARNRICDQGRIDVTQMRVRIHVENRSCQIKLRHIVIKFSREDAKTRKRNLPSRSSRLRVRYSLSFP